MPEAINVEGKAVLKYVHRTRLQRSIKKNGRSNGAGAYMRKGPTVGVMVKPGVNF
jgi:hypothetical protein